MSEVRNRIALSGGSLLFTLLLLAGLEIVLRVVNPRRANDPFVNIPSPLSIFSEVERDGVRLFEVTHPDAYRARTGTYPVHKASGTFRIFCLGESASAGWPHPPDQVYSEYLRRALAAAYPERTVEVINVGAHGYASYRLRLIHEDLLRFEPDLLIYYIGNNEFLERRSYLSGSGGEGAVEALGRSLRIVWFARSILEGLLHPDNTLAGRQRVRISDEIWTKVHKTAVTMRKDPDQFAKVKDHFAFTMEEMVSDAERKGVPVILLTVPVNLRDWLPNVSFNSLSGSAFDEWSGLFDAGERAMALGRSREALEAFSEAAERDPQHAETFFWKGRALELLGSFPVARESYVQAKDLDYNPFRALTAFNDSIRAISARHGNARLLDAERMISAGAPHALPGFDLFLDYVHPTVAGNLLLARAVFDEIIRANYLEMPAARLDFARPELGAYDEKGDVELQITLLWLFGLMHQHESMVHKAHAISMLPGVRARLKPNQVRLLDGVLEHVTKYVEIRRRQILGEPVDAAEERKNSAALNQLYEDLYLTPIVGRERPAGEHPVF